MSFPKNLADGLLMTLSDFEVGDTTLDFTYTVTNQSEYDAYFINALYYFLDTDLQVDPNMVYAELGDNSTLYLSKQLLLIPDHLKVEAPEVPLATQIVAGATFSESLRLALPVAPHDPYEPQTYASSPSSAKSVIFSLGYVIADQPIPVQQVTIPSGDQYWYFAYGDLYEHQRLKVNDPIEADVPTVATYES